MGSIPPEVSLDFKPAYIPKTIGEFLGEVSNIGDVSDRISKLDDFVRRLEEERKKIDAFKRELPLCMLLLVDAIMTLKEQLIRCRATTIEPILEEFIPIKKSGDEDGKCDVKKEKDNSRDKMNWMSSVRLWSHANTNLSCDEKQKSSAQIKQNGEEDNQKATGDPSQSSENVTAERVFMSFKRSSGVPVATTTRTECNKGGFPSAGLSLLTPCADNPKEELGSSVLSYRSCGGKAGSSSGPSGPSNLHTVSHLQASRKQRRCWSPELHRRFVDALQQLGGSQVATPKQIRELMQVDGLTNDEVKSHLQKYRLHTRRLPAAATIPTNQSLAVFGGLWMHQEHSGESSKPSCSQSGSPQGPLQLAGGGISITGEECLDEEEDDKSECYSWKNRFHYSGKDDL